MLSFVLPSWFPAADGSPPSVSIPGSFSSSPPTFSSSSPSAPSAASCPPSPRPLPGSPGHSSSSSSSSPKLPEGFYMPLLPSSSPPPLFASPHPPLPPPLAVAGRVCTFVTKAWSRFGAIKYFLISGLMDAAGNSLGFIAQPYVSGPVFSLMNQAIVPFSAIVSMLILGKRYTLLQCSALVIVIAGFLVSWTTGESQQLDCLSFLTTARSAVRTPWTGHADLLETDYYLQPNHGAFDAEFKAANAETGHSQVYQLDEGQATRTTSTERARVGVSSTSPHSSRHSVNTSRGASSSIGDGVAGGDIGNGGKTSNSSSTTVDHPSALNIPNSSSSSLGVSVDQASRAVVPRELKSAEAEALPPAVSRRPSTLQLAGENSKGSASAEASEVESFVRLPDAPVCMFALIVAVSTLPSAISFTVKELVLRKYRERYGGEEDLNVLVILTFGSLCQLLWTPLALPLNYFLGLTHGDGLLVYAREAVWCLTGHTCDREGGELCKYAPLAYSIYILINLFFNFALISLVQAASSLLTFICLKAVLPISILLFWVAPWPLLDQVDVNVTAYTAMSLSIILFGIVLYQYGRVKNLELFKEHQPPCCWPIFGKKKKKKNKTMPALSEQDIGKYVHSQLREEEEEQEHEEDEELRRRPGRG
eukprot:GHVT01075047.1.p1 GENE.GHVT01075047.1~~GHVT01075047.1.p1  ORF type:complete len:648 (+),score=137.27 GHVT01075047.1:75-2018(+)